MGEAIRRLTSLYSRFPSKFLGSIDIATLKAYKTGYRIIIRSTREESKFETAKINAYLFITIVER